MRAGRLAVCALIAASLLGHSFAASPLFFEDFGGQSWKSSFVKSKDEKYSGVLVAENPPGLEEPALKVTEKAKHYGYAANLGTDVDPSEGLVLQYDLKLADGLTCGGAYLKFLTASEEFEAGGLVEDTPYVIMFGPDKCGATNKVHLILRHKAPSGEIEEKHLKNPPMILQDKDTHVYTAVLKPADNTYEILIDGESKKSGSLFEDFEPPFNPPEEIDDPEDKKPDDWVDQARISDPDAVKPDNWDEDAPSQIEDEDAEKPEGWLDDEAQQVEDPEAEKPDDWDDEEDGEWEPPMIPNPKCAEGPGCGEWKRPKIANPAYKGKWSAPLIDNPEYKGPWKARKVPNPKYYIDEQPLKNVGKIGGVAIEIWTMDDSYYFDNFLIANDPEAAEEARNTYWEPKKAAEKILNEKQAQEEAAKQAAESRSFGERITSLFDLPGLSTIRGPLEPALDFIEDNDYAAYAVAASLAIVPVFLFLSCLPKGKTKKAAKVSLKEVKKGDKPVPDDKGQSATSEIIDDEDDEDEKKGVRRRPRRE